MATLGMELVLGLVDHVIGIIITRAVDSITAEKSESFVSQCYKVGTLFMSFKNSANVVHRSQTSFDAPMQW